ncbi:unnamed protein product, partial [Coregonus sp. 'balchen']
MNCCEGDILLLLDSSGSLSSYEVSRVLRFLSELLLPFSQGRGQVRVGLLQVGTEPHLEFGLDAHSTQSGLQGALQRTRQIQGDTNTEAALRLAQGQLARAGAVDELQLPMVLVWLTDGVQPGTVAGPMAELRRACVSLLAVSTGHRNYQVLQRVVTPPIKSHQYFVDIDDISIITEDLREAIIEVLSPAVVTVSDSGPDRRYQIEYGALPIGQVHTVRLHGHQNSTLLTGLEPETQYLVTVSALYSTGKE